MSPSSTMVETLDAPMLDYAAQQDVLMQSSSTSSMWYTEDNMEEDRQYSEFSVVEVDMETYAHTSHIETAEYEMSDDGGGVVVHGDDGVVDVDVPDASHIHTPAVVEISLVDEQQQQQLGEEEFGFLAPVTVEDDMSFIDSPLPRPEIVQIQESAAEESYPAEEIYQQNYAAVEQHYQPVVEQDVVEENYPEPEDQAAVEQTSVEETYPSAAEPEDQAAVEQTVIEEIYPEDQAAVEEDYPAAEEPSEDHAAVEQEAAAEPEDHAAVEQRDSIEQNYPVVEQEDQAAVQQDEPTTAELVEEETTIEQTADDETTAGQSDEAAVEQGDDPTVAETVEENDETTVEPGDETTVERDDHSAVEENEQGTGDDPPVEETVDEVDDQTTTTVEQETTVEETNKDPHEISEGVYIDPPPPVILTVGTPPEEVYLFNRPKDGKEVVLLQQQPTLYYEPVWKVFSALREEEYISHMSGVADSELVFDAYDLQLIVGEDNIYAREVSLHDINLVHDGLEISGPLRMRLDKVTPRFIVRYRMLHERLTTDQEQEQQEGPVEESWDDSLDAEGEPEEHWEEESIVTLSSSKRSIYEVEEEPTSSPTGNKRARTEG